MTEAAASQIRSVAEILAANDPGTWRRLSAAHVADHSGHCRACWSSSGAAPVWPCRLRAIADEAEQITAGRRPTTESGPPRSRGGEVVPYRAGRTVTGRPPTVGRAPRS